MSLTVLPYDLPDLDIKTSDKKNDFKVWQPEENILVLGRSNNAEDSLNTDLVLEDRVRVYKRPSGGESVILTPNTLVVAVKIHIGEDLNMHKYFRVVNDKIMAALSDLGVKGLYMKGISDISIGEKKILGSSIHRVKETLYYHAVLNINESIETISKYLKHPKKEPDYRQGRSHIDFVTSLHLESFTLNTEEISRKLIKYLKK